MGCYNQNILGVYYKIFIGMRKELETLGLSPENQGETQFFKKQILICVEFTEDYSNSLKQDILSKILCHELAHAFLYESGRTDDANDESLVCWLEIMVEKIFNTYQNVFDNLIKGWYNINTL